MIFARVAAAVFTLLLATSPVAASVTSVAVSKCLAGKLKGVGKSVAARAGCYSKDSAKPDAAALAACLAKADDKFDGGAAPSKGVFEKLETKYPPASATPCLTFDDTASQNGGIAAYAADLDGDVGDALGKCDAAKKKCLGKYVAAVMGCFAKAANKGGSVDTGCTGKAATKLANGANGCLDKAAANGDCSTPGTQAVALQNTADTFMRSASSSTCDLDPGNPGCTPVCGDSFLDAGENCDAPAAGTCGAEFACVACNCGCPTRLELTPDASASAATVLDLGWTGLAQDEPLNSKSDLTVALACGPSTRPCGTCTVTGLAPNDTAAGGLANRRCTNDTSIRCTSNTPCTPGGGTCEYYFGPPLGIAVGGVPACLDNRVDGPLTGTADIESGAIAVATTLVIGIHPEGSIDLPCPRCVGDTVANDGALNGTCNGGERDGMSCDANGNVPQRPDYGLASLDCPPSSGTLAGTITLALDAAAATVTRALTAASPSCTEIGYTSRKCVCDTCNNAIGQLCFSDADCPISGGNPGICGGRRCIGGLNAGAPCTTVSACPAGVCSRLGESTQPSTCLDDTTTGADETICDDTTPIGDGKGECPYGPIDKTCANHPGRSCGNDGDCDSVGGACQSHARSCYTANGFVGDTLRAVGVADAPTADVAAPTLASVSCAGPVTSSAANAAIGLPGPSRLVLESSARFRP